MPLCPVAATIATTGHKVIGNRGTADQPAGSTDTGGRSSGGMPMGVTR